jgi:hypothetical protein
VALVEVPRKRSDIENSIRLSDPFHEANKIKVIPETFYAVVNNQASTIFCSGDHRINRLSWKFPSATGRSIRICQSEWLPKTGRWFHLGHVTEKDFCRPMIWLFSAAPLLRVMGVFGDFRHPWSRETSGQSEVTLRASDVCFMTCGFPRNTLKKFKLYCESCQPGDKDLKSVDDKKASVYVTRILWPEVTIALTKNLRYGKPIHEYNENQYLMNSLVF